MYAFVEVYGPGARGFLLCSDSEWGHAVHFVTHGRSSGFRDIGVAASHKKAFHVGRPGNECTCSLPHYTPVYAASSNRGLRFFECLCIYRVVREAVRGRACMARMG